MTEPRRSDVERLLRADDAPTRLLGAGLLYLRGIMVGLLLGSLVAGAILAVAAVLG